MNGIEDMTLDFTSATGHKWGVEWHAGWNCWAKNVKTIKGEEAHFHTYYGGRIEVRHCFLFGTQGGASQSYGILPYFVTGMWAEDNIGNEIVGIVVPGSCATAWVGSYNYATNTLYTPDTWMVGTLAPHAAHNTYGIFEGNHADGMTADYIHGSGSHNTIFRNRLVGWEPGKTDHTYVIDIWRTNWNFNVVANILGKSGYHDTYSTVNGAGSPVTAIYRWGDHGNYSSQVYDPVSLSSAIVHANYDVVTAGQVFDGGIADHSPVSSYIYPSGRPSWWGTALPWPPFDPASTSAAAIDPTNINAGYRFIFGVDPPAGGGGGGQTGSTPSRPKRGGGGRGGIFR